MSLDEEIKIAAAEAEVYQKEAELKLQQVQQLKDLQTEFNQKIKEQEDKLHQDKPQGPAYF